MTKNIVKSLDSHIKAAVKSYNEMQMWSFVRGMAESEKERHLIDIALYANVKDVMKNAYAYLRKMETAAVLEAKKVKKTEKKVKKG